MCGFAAIVPTVTRKRTLNARHHTSDDLAVSDNTAASYARFSSDKQREESNKDQQRMCREKAEKNGHNIQLKHEFKDSAVSGTKLHRKGLDAMLRSAEAGEFKVLYFYSLSRLARESIITMPMLKRLVYKYNIRVISVTEGIDSDHNNWELISAVLSIFNENFLKDLAANVLRGQESAVLAGHSAGDYRFGYSSEPVPGTENSRRGKDAKPRMQYVIDDKTAPWVKRIFHWFVQDRLSITQITKNLNKLNAPKDHRSTTEYWDHEMVTRTLSSVKYIGIWPWGENKNVRDPETGNVSQESRPEEETEKWRRDLPHLQFIDNETFEKAQTYLQENRDKHEESRNQDGTFNTSPRNVDNSHPRHLLSCLIYCAGCGSKFYVGGNNGKYMHCPKYKNGTCECKTTLQRERAEKMILDEIGQLILEDSNWVQSILNQTLRTWKLHEQQVPAELASAVKALKKVEQKITTLVDQIEDGCKIPDVGKRFDERRTERRELVKQIEKLKKSLETHSSIPTEQWVREQLQQLGDCLQSGTPAAAYALRSLVGGKIVVTEIKKDGCERHYLQGHFVVQACSLIDTSSEDNEPEVLTREIVIDFVDPNPLDAESEQAKALYDQKLMNVEIGKRLKCSKSKVTKLIRHWFESRGLEMPDGRSRRAQLTCKHQEPPMYQRISDEVKQLYDKELLIGDIAEKMGCDRNTITEANRFWYESRGLEVIDGRTRRKSLKRKASSKSTDNDNESSAA
ncbi:MAG: recombinase family protein [Pirellulales bacterium]